MSRPVPHSHTCAGCGKGWPCENAACTDLPLQTCGCGLPLPQAVQWTRGLEDAGHALDEAAFAFRRRRQLTQAAGCTRVRLALISQARQLARAHGLPTE